MGKALKGKRGEGQRQGWEEELRAEREGGEGSGRVIFISCVLWIMMTVLSGVTGGSDYADLLVRGGQKVRRVCGWARTSVCASSPESRSPSFHKVSSSISHQSEMGLKTPDSISFTLL